MFDGCAVRIRSPDGRESPLSAEIAEILAFAVFTVRHSVCTGPRVRAIERLKGTDETDIQRHTQVAARYNGSIPRGSRVVRPGMASPAEHDTPKGLPPEQFSATRRRNAKLRILRQLPRRHRCLGLGGGGYEAEPVDYLERRACHLLRQRGVQSRSGDEKCKHWNVLHRPWRHMQHECQRTHRSEEHTSELQSLRHLVCRLLLEKKKK